MPTLLRDALGLVLGEVHNVYLGVIWHLRVVQS